MKNLYKGCFVTLACDVTRYGKTSKAGTSGIITGVENDTYEVVTEENQFIYCKAQELRQKHLMSYEEALKTLEQYNSHHCKSENLFQFNIKLYHYSIPPIVTEQCEENAVWDRFYEMLNESLECFMGQNCDYGLSYIIPWVGSKAGSDWWQAGRSGGWLIVRCDIDCETSAENVEYVR